MTADGPRETESPLPLCLGGPYYPREDVLAIRRDAVEVVQEMTAKAPEPLRAEALAVSTEDLAGELFAVLDRQVAVEHEFGGGDAGEPAIGRIGERCVALVLSNGGVTLS
jgi:hypothetical protein